MFRSIIMSEVTQYNQELVNDSLANTLEMDPLKNIQEPIKKGPGGKRAGAGRKAGSTNKIQGGEFLEEYKRIHGSSLKEDLARDMLSARARGDYDMLFRYQTAFAKYYFSDVAAQDITSNGKTLKAVFNFPSTELSDWKK